MANYVLAFRGSPARSPVEGEEEAWGAWFGSLGPAVADFGHRVTSVDTLHPETGSTTEAQVLTGYVVIAAENPGQARTFASGCPGLRSGLSVEIAQIVEA